MWPWLWCKVRKQIFLKLTYTKIIIVITLGMDFTTKYLQIYILSMHSNQMAIYYGF